MRMYGIVGLVSKFANWNADFDGYPKRTIDGIYASDKALKYVMRRYFEEQGQKVFYKKTIEENGRVLTYEERYEKLFGKANSLKEVIRNLLSCIDIKLFGSVVTFKASKDDANKNDKSDAKKKKKNDKEEKSTNVNAGIRGPVQFTHGKNLYKNTNVIREIITSQFASKIGAIQTTIGEQIFTDESHYFYSFSLNQDNLLDFENLIEGDKLKLTKDELELFKKACLNAVDAYNSTSKAGCNNSFALFIETDEDIYMPSLMEYIEMEDRNIVLDELINLLDKEYKDKIKNATVYYRPKFIGIKDLEKVKEKFEVKEF